VLERFVADVSKWVRSAVFQQLGPFLATLPRAEITPELLQHYTGMIGASANGNEPADDELRLFCAFSFPAVALTLGKDRCGVSRPVSVLNELPLFVPIRWGELRDTFAALARDIQWQVRRTLSFSLHEVAKVLGPEMAEKELLSTFDLFLHDLDEVSHASSSICSVSRFTLGTALIINIVVPAREGRRHHTPW
jgi:serine/threonine-protein phosphatase 4 regulatory subunit 1